MTNAEKLAKDTDVMAEIIRNYCRSTNCPSCPFCERTQNDGVFCKIVTYETDTFDNDIKKWLESEVEEDAEIH